MYVLRDAKNTQVHAFVMVKNTYIIKIINEFYHVSS